MEIHKKFLYKLILGIYFIVLLFTIGCGGVEKGITLTISAASSLKESMEEIKQIYLMEKSDITIVYNFGASGTLLQQIEQGAEVDIFVSAALKQMKELEDKDFLIDDTKVNLVGNKVVLIVPKGSTGISGFRDLTGHTVGKIAVGESKSVPVGQYAREVLNKLNIFKEVESKLIYGNNAKQLLTWVETGNSDAGIVYETDARASDKVRIVEVAPENSHEPVKYPGAVIKTGKNINSAKDFLKFLTSRKAKEVFKKYGFLIEDR